MIFEVFFNLNDSKVLWFQNTHLYQPVKCLTPLMWHLQEFHSSLPGWLPSLGTNRPSGALHMVSCPAQRKPCWILPYLSLGKAVAVAQSFPQIVFTSKKTRVNFGHTVGYTSLLWTSIQRHFLKIFSLHWSTSNVKAQCWSRLRFECQLHFYWLSVTSKGFSSTNVQTGRLPWNLSAMLTYRFWTDFICRLMPENEH